MKFLQLLLSLLLAFLLCAVPVIRAQVPQIPTAAPTPPNGESGTDAPGPPMAPTTVESPEVSTIYPNYAG